MSLMLGIWGRRLPATVVVSPVWVRRPMACLLVLGLIALGLPGRDREPGGGDYEKYHTRSFIVQNVVDGDTFDIAVRDGKYDRTRVRLWGVDTPEVEGSRDGAMHFGKEASAFAKRTLLGKRVTILLAPSRSRDKYGRLLAYATLEAHATPEEDRQGYAELLLTSGLAYADWRFKHALKTQYKALERRARKNGIGLWADVRPDQMPQWRQRMERELDYKPPVR